MPPRVLAVHKAAEHAFSKEPVDAITLVAGRGVEGDAHYGVTVQHRSRVAADPTQPNLRQVHLIHGELLDDLRTAGFDVQPGQLGENVTTYGVGLLELPTGTLLHLGDATMQLTGLRNPCAQIDGFRHGLLKQVVRREADGTLARLAGVMGVVVTGGEVRAGAEIRVDLPEGPHLPLDRV